MVSIIIQKQTQYGSMRHLVEQTVKTNGMTKLIQENTKTIVFTNQIQVLVKKFTKKRTKRSLRYSNKKN